MKKFIILLAVAVSSLSLFSCTTDEIAEDLNEEVTLEEFAVTDIDVMDDED